MQRDAESHAAEDKQKRELAEARNTAEQRVYQLEKLLEENKDKLSDSDKVGPPGGDRQGQRGQEGGRRRGDQPGRRELQRASQAMAEHLYSAGDPAPGAGCRTRTRARTGPPHRPTAATAPEARRRHRRRVRGEKVIASR